MKKKREGEREIEKKEKKKERKKGRKKEKKKKKEKRNKEKEDIYIYIKAVGVPAEIPTWHFSNRSQYYYSLGQLAPYIKVVKYKV